MGAISKINVLPLGQSGFRFEAGGNVLYVDPYLSDHVAEVEGEHMRRMAPIVLSPEDVTDARWVLVSHIHLDHCDPATLPSIAKASPGCQFIGPREVVDFLGTELAISKSRLHVAQEEWFSLGKKWHLRAVPAAHCRIERDEKGNLRCIGYIMKFEGRCFYHSGDCSIHPDIIEILQANGPIDVAFLPVNECNYYRDRAGIIGNMSIREAFGLAEEIGVGTLVPVHYDMFAPNCVYEEEIAVVYGKTAPPFQLLFKPRRL
jgi:L-ascorbate metabolism protein UlaG (beta-lactamase superfamily)